MIPNLFYAALQMLNLFNYHYSIKLFNVFLHILEDIVDVEHRWHHLAVIVGKIFAIFPILLQIIFEFDDKLGHVFVVYSFIFCEGNLHFAIQQAQFFDRFQLGHFIVLLKFSLHRFVILNAQELLSDSAVS